jgi:hypothetical protein
MGAIAPVWQYVPNAKKELTMTKKIFIKCGRSSRGCGEWGEALNQLK